MNKFSNFKIHRRIYSHCLNNNLEKVENAPNLHFITKTVFLLWDSRLPYFLAHSFDTRLLRTKLHL